MYANKYLRKSHMLLSDKLTKVKTWMLSPLQTKNEVFIYRKEEYKFFSLF